ncbi:MAG: hypothetical protein AB8C02_12845 [Halioglobus sp.]
MLRTILLAITLLALGGCKLAVMLVEGGSVTSASSGDCSIVIPGAGTACIHQISDTSYTETFTAVPDTGWAFVKWNSGGNFLCEESTNPVCAVSNVALAGIPAFEAVVASDQAFYVMPIFEAIAGAIADTINAPDGNEWAQIDLFDGLTYAEIAAVCAGGPCSGTLNGFDMDGWTWASAQDVLDLFNSYEATGSVTAPVPGTVFISTTFIPALVLSGFNPTNLGPSGGDQLGGFTSDPELTSFATTTDLSQLPPVTPGRTGLEVGNTPINAPSGDDEGGWFYR